MPKILPGHFDLKALSIISDGGNQTIDLLPRMWTQIHIFESILTPTITGYVVVTDVENLISGVKNGLPILGNEIIYMEIELPRYYVEKPDGKYEQSNSNLIRYIGRITDIKNKNIINDRSHNYEIHFASEEMVLDRNLSISKSYKKKTLSSIAKNIFDNFNSICDSEFESSVGTHDVIIPNWSPLKAINWLASRSISEYGFAPFLFFQTLYTDNSPNTDQQILDNNTLSSYKGEVASKYWFVSLDFLLRYPPRKTLRFIPSKTRQAEPNTEEEKQEYMKFSNVLNYRVIHSFDTIEANNTGLFNSSLITHDITKKTWTRHTFNYDDIFYKLFHTEKEEPGKFYSGTKDILGNTFTSPQYKESLHMMAPTGTYESPNGLENVSSIRNSRISTLNNYKIEVLIPGDGLIESGDVIEFKIPSPERSAEKGLYDQYYSGNYLVTAIRHVFSKGEYRMQLECSKESLKKEPRG